MDEMVLPWFEYVGLEELPPWALLMIIPSLVIGLTASLKVFKLNGVSKAGLKVTVCNASEQKSSGKERLLTDDLLLNDTGVEGAQVTGIDDNKHLLNKEAPVGFFSGGENRRLGLLDSRFPGKPSSEGEVKHERSSTTDGNTSGPGTDGTNNPVSPKMMAKDDTFKSGVLDSTVVPRGFVGDSTSNLGSESKVDDIDSNENKRLGFIDANPNPYSNKSEEPESLFVEVDKKEIRHGNLDFLSSPVAFLGKSEDDVSSNSPSTVMETSHRDVTDPPENAKVSKVKKSISEFNPNFVNATSDRKLNIGRPNQENKKKRQEKSYFLEKSESEEGLTNVNNSNDPSGFELRKSPSSGMVKSSTVQMPNLISPQTYHDYSKKHYGFDSIGSIIHAKNNEKHAEKFHLGRLSESKIHAKPFPVDAIDPLSIPGYKPSLSEKPILPVDFIKFAEPVRVTSYDLVPGPSLLKTVGNIWKYVPLLGTQFVATVIYSMQSVISSYDRRMKYTSSYPYFYLLNKYGPMVRLHGPVGADILIMAINGQNYPIVHVKSISSKRQSLFDSLNTYRRDAAPLSSYMMNIPKMSKKIPDNPTLTIDHHFASLENVTDDFIKRRKFIRNYSGAKENDNHENDLLRWAMQCTMNVYFKTKRDYFNQGSNESTKIIESFSSVTKSLRLCETGVQLWRAFATLAWLDLTEYCKDMDRFIMEEVSQCLINTSEGHTSGSVLELLLTTEELNPADILTPLLDLLLINVNMAATTAGFLLYYLSKTPQVQRTLFREISSVLAKGAANIHQIDLTKLKYLNACITETMRMVPAFPILNRQLEVDTRIHGFQIPKGTYIQMVNVMPCERGDMSFDDIGRFQAERWVDKSTILGGDPLTGLPQWQSFPTFNRDLIVTQVALLVAKLVREYRVEYPSTEIHPDGMVLQGPTTSFNFAFIERVI